MNYMPFGTAAKPLSGDLKDLCQKAGITFNLTHIQQEMRQSRNQKHPLFAIAVENGRPSIDINGNKPLGTIKLGFDQNHKLEYIAIENSGRGGHAYFHGNYKNMLSAANTLTELASNSGNDSLNFMVKAARHFGMPFSNASSLLQEENATKLKQTIGSALLKDGLHSQMSRPIQHDFHN